MDRAPERALEPSRRAALTRRVRLLVAATIAYSAFETVVALAAGRAAGSSALLGFGLDSVVEVASAAIVAWQFAAPVPEARERTALRLIAFAFFALSVVVTVDAARLLLGADAPEPSPVGIALALTSLVVSPALAFAKRRAGRQLGSPTTVADSTQTLMCGALAAVLLAGLVLNATLGWAWADPLAALVIAGWAAREGVEAWRGDARTARGREMPDGGA